METIIGLAEKNYSVGVGGESLPVADDDPLS